MHRLEVLMVLLLLILASTCHAQTQHDAPTVHYYSPDGKLLGSASVYGNTTKFYAADGKLLGSATELMEKINGGATTTTKVPGLPVPRNR